MKILWPDANSYHGESSVNIVFHVNNNKQCYAYISYVHVCLRETLSKTKVGIYLDILCPMQHVPISFPSLLQYNTIAHDRE